MVLEIDGDTDSALGWPATQKLSVTLVTIDGGAYDAANTGYRSNFANVTT